MTGIYLISPSGAVPEPARLERAATRLRELGYSVAIDPEAASVHQRFAGDDDTRLQAIQRSLEQELPVVMATRGGYGLSRLLPAIDWAAVADSGKLFVGHSDFTAFQLALLAQTGTASLAGPGAVSDFGGSSVDELTCDVFQEMLAGVLDLVSFPAPDADPVDEWGILWGGNLAMLTSLLGTPYFPCIEDGILFLEDVGEHPYRIERMLAQLWQAGVLQKQKALLLGHFNEYRLAAHDNGYDLAAVIDWLRTTSGVPVITGLPFGHVASKICLPVGRRVGLACEDYTAHIVFEP